MINEKRSSPRKDYGDRSRDGGDRRDSNQRRGGDGMFSRGGGSSGRFNDRNGGDRGGYQDRRHSGGGSGNDGGYSGFRGKTSSTRYDGQNFKPKKEVLRTMRIEDFGDDLKVMLKDLHEETRKKLESEGVKELMPV